MTTYRQLVRPNLAQTAGAGWCLFFVRSAFGVPEYSARATQAANKTHYRHPSRTMPNAIVPVWFWHQGTYGEGYGEYGHVVIWVPGRGFLSSPGYGYGQEWLASLEAVEARFRCQYRFWSEDIGGVRVVQPVNRPAHALPTVSASIPEEDDDMRPTIHFRTEGNPEWTRAHPDIGKDLKPGQSRKDGNVVIYRGFEATANKTVGTAWARQYARGVGGETSRTNRAGYRQIQKQATRLSVAIHG